MCKLHRLIVLVLLAGLATSAADLVAAERPNILWLFAEDTSPWMGCYGDEINSDGTPQIDSLAARGVRFSRAFVPAPVCSACRSAMMVGQNQIRFGAHEHRSSRGPAKISLPPGIKLLPELIQSTGYFTFNLGKTDYNFVWDEPATYSLLQAKRTPVPWDVLKENQPFFGQIQTAGGKQNTNQFPADRKVDPASVTVPPDYPQNELYHEVVAEHYDSIRKDDDFIGEVLAGLAESGLADNTIVVYLSDHGANNLVRHKQMPTEGGLHVPFIIAGPRDYVPGQQVRDDLVSLLDLSATTLTWAGVEIPDWYEGQDLFGAVLRPRAFVASAKDRLDHTIDRVRTIRTDRYRYTRNFKTDRIFLQPQYRDPKDFVINLRELYANGELDPKLVEIYFGERPAEELYDVRDDPHQLINLVGDPAFASVLDEHRELLAAWLAKGDMGIGEEPAAELAFQAGDQKWGRAVNPEYESVRTDSDGDGLSDAWEQINDRDPSDGKLEFTFECGGWQTEGWESEGELGNIAGPLGRLDFTLPDGPAKLIRRGLAIEAERNPGALAIKIRTSEPMSIELLRDGDKSEMRNVAAAVDVASSNEFTTVEIPLSNREVWTGTIKTLELKMSGRPGTLVEIDAIEVSRERVGGTR